VAGPNVIACRAAGFAPSTTSPQINRNSSCGYTKTDDYELLARAWMVANAKAR